MAVSHGHCQAARELRDKYLEQVNSPGGESLLPASAGKYDVSRQLAPASGNGAAPSSIRGREAMKVASDPETPLLEAA